MKWRSGERIEKWHPLLFSVIVFIALFFAPSCAFPPYDTAFDNVIGAVVTSSSILIGFVGVLLSLLIGVKETPLIISLFEIKGASLLRKYFAQSILSGFFLLVLSVILYLRDWIVAISSGFEFDAYSFLVSLWVSLIIFVVLAACRIINIMMIILFKSNRMPKIDSIEMDENEAKQLQEKYKRTD